ncbi:MAG: glutamate--tRNA ligase [Candidatus Woesearchaeota archaeon]
MDNLIRKYALQNAVRYEGKAQAGAVIGKVFSEKPNLDKKEVAKQVNLIVKEINKLSFDEQKKLLNDLAPELLEKKKGEERTELPPLKDAVEGKVVTRLPPEPSKYNHVGHALSFLINYMYAKKYKGKCILRFEDTNPAKAKQEYVDAMQIDVLDYLGIKVDKTIFASDDMALFYSLAEKLTRAGKAYVCCCDIETMREKRHKGLVCECCQNCVELNLEKWQAMLNRKFAEGKAVLRLKGDMCADNHCMRDPVIFRVVADEHYRQGKKYSVWPVYDFENAVEDSVNKVTHVLRSSEFGNMRIELQAYIKELLGLPQQVVIHYSRYNIAGATTQGREIREMIEKKQIIGWDDPRLVTLRAMKRRGIDKRTYYELVHKVGLSLSDKKIDWSVIAAVNRKIIDPEVNRYFFVQDPKLVKIENAPEQKVELDLHPDFPERGKRVFNTHNEFYICTEDFDVLKEGKLYRLMDCLNFMKKGAKLVFDSLEYAKFKEKGAKIIHWLPKQDLISVEVMMPNATLVKGLGEPSLLNLKVGEVIQAQRFGFMRLDRVEKDKLTFWYTHK